MRIRKPSIASLSSSPREKVKELLLHDPTRGLHTRPSQNWRNVLLGYNAQTEAVRVGKEGEKPYYRSNGILRIREDKMRLLTNEGARMKEANSSRAQRELVVESEGGGPKLDLFEKSLVSMGQGVKRKRSRVVRSAKYDSTSVMKEINKQPMAANDNDDIRFQCRKRKCPGRTVVGYSLCERHLGKTRLGSFDAVVVKGTKIKDLRLIEVACKGVHKHEE